VDFVQNKVGKKQKGIQTVFCYDLMKVEYQPAPICMDKIVSSISPIVTVGEGA
jgi:hypothetical protein